MSLFQGVLIRGGYLYTGRGFRGQRSVQDYQWVSGKSVVSEDETSSTATDAVLQVLPVTQRVDRLVLTDLVINRFREQVYIYI